MFIRLDRYGTVRRGIDWVEAQGPEGTVLIAWDTQGKHRHFFRPKGASDYQTMIRAKTGCWLVLDPGPAPRAL